MEYLFLAVALTLNTIANTLMKIGAKNLDLIKEHGLVQGLLKDWVILIGVFLFAANIIFYVIALSKINLSVAYPIMTIGGLLLITLISYIVFKETLTPIQMGGIAFLIIGIIMVSGKF